MPPHLAHAPGHSDDMKTHTDTSTSRSTELPVAVLVEGKTPRHSQVRSRYLYHAARLSRCGRWKWVGVEDGGVGVGEG